MLSKRSWMVILTGVNLFLLALLSLASYKPSTALAQTRGARPGDFLCVTAKAQGQAFDVVYVLDRPAQKLHAFYPTGVLKKQHAHGGFRDLKADFGD